MICIKLASEEWDFPKKHSHFTRYGGTPSHSNHTVQEHGSSKDGNTVQEETILVGLCSSGMCRVALLSSVLHYRSSIAVCSSSDMATSNFLLSLKPLGRNNKKRACLIFSKGLGIFLKDL